MRHDGSVANTHDGCCEIVVLADRQLREQPRSVREPDGDAAQSAAPPAVKGPLRVEVGSVSLTVSG